MKKPEYLSYMLRIWSSKTDGPPEWRASLESAHTGDRHAFADLQSMLQFLEAQLEQPLEETEDQAGEKAKEDQEEGNRSLELKRFIWKKRIH